MSTLITIHSVTAFHLPTKTSEPIPLANGDLVLTLVPSNPPATPTPTLTLTVGTTSFPISHDTPISATDTTSQHTAYIFTPTVPLPTPTSTSDVTSTEIASVGHVKLVFKNSMNPAEFDETEALARHFEGILKEQNVWRETDYYTDDDTQTVIGAAITGSFGATLSSFGHSLARGITGFTDSHIEANPNLQHPAPPGETTKSMAATFQSSTATLAQYTHVAAEKLGEVVHDGAKYVGGMVKDLTQHQGTPVRQSEGGNHADVEQGELGGETATREVADTWEEVKLDAPGAADGTTALGSSASSNIHRAVEHDFRSEADEGAKDIGQGGANIGTAG